MKRLLTSVLLLAALLGVFELSGCVPITRFVATDYRPAAAPAEPVADCKDLRVLLTVSGSHYRPTTIFPGVYHEKKTGEPFHYWFTLSGDFEVMHKARLHLVDASGAAIELAQSEKDFVRKTRSDGINVNTGGPFKFPKSLENDSHLNSEVEITGANGARTCHLKVILKERTSTWHHNAVLQRILSLT